MEKFGCHKMVLGDMAMVEASLRSKNRRKNPGTADEGVQGANSMAELWERDADHIRSGVRDLPETA